MLSVLSVTGFVDNTEGSITDYLFGLISFRLCFSTLFAATASFLVNTDKVTQVRVLKLFKYEIRGIFDYLLRRPCFLNLILSIFNFK